MGPREFRNEVVQPNCDDFLADYTSVRLAFNAIAAIDALAAQIYVWSKANNPGAVQGIRDDSLYRAALAQQDLDFALLRDVAKAQKHVHLEQGNPQVTNAHQVVNRGVGFGEALGVGRLGGDPQVLIVTDTGRIHIVEDLLSEALTALDAEMVRVSIP